MARRQGKGFEGRGWGPGFFQDMVRWYNDKVYDIMADSMADSMWLRSTVPLRGGAREPVSRRGGPGSELQWVMGVYHDEPNAILAVVRP